MAESNINNGAFEGDQTASSTWQTFNEAKQDFNYLESTKATVEEAIAAANGVIWKATLAEVNAIDPLVADTAYGVYEDGDNNGYYYWDGTSATVTFNRDLGVEKTDDINDTSGKAIEAKAVKEFVNTEKINDIGFYFKNYEKNFFTQYDGQGARSRFDGHTLSLDGDYIEFNVIFNQLSSQQAMGVVGQHGTSNSNFGAWTNGNVYIRNSSGTWLDLDALGEKVVVGEIIKIKLLWVSGGIEVYKNDVLKKTITTGTFIVDNFGTSYNSDNNTFNGAISGLVIKSGETIYDYGSPFLIPNIIHTLDVKFSNLGGFLNDEQAAKVDYSKCYVSYDPTGYDSRALFEVYQQDRNTKNKYYKYTIANEFDDSELEYSNQWRVIKCEVFVFDGLNMNFAGLTALSGGESEFVYRTPGKSDFTGGWHGDEQLVNVTFFIDEVEYTPLNKIDLKPCSSFAYLQDSTLHETAASGDIVNTSHPIEAEHLKLSSFKDYEFTSENVVKWKAAINVSVCYGSIVSVALDFGGKAKSDNLEVVALTQDNTNKLEEVNDNANLWNTTNETAAYIKSIFDINNDTSEQFIWDRTTYNKYYRDVCSAGTISVVDGDVWKFKTVVEFSIK